MFMDHLASEPLLSVRGIRKSFGGVEVLPGVDLDATAGRVVALLGENGAGKSTLVKIISGDYQPNGGEIIVRGQSFDRLTPITAGELGIKMIYQEINDAGSLTVAENIFLGRLPSKAGFVRWREIRRRAREILDELQVDINPDARMSTLRVGQRQVIEIARALSEEASLLILDEPTAALSGDEVDTLFEFLDRLRDQGTAMIYITHRLDELRRVADDVVVLRDGHVALVANAADTPRAELVHAMVGADIDDVRRPDPLDIDPNLPSAIEMVELSSEDAFRDVTLEVKPGEVVALYGKVGSGIAEVAEAAFGMRKLTGGSLLVEQEPPGRSPRDAIGKGVGLLPADRKREGAFLIMSSAKNLVAPFWSGRLGRAFWAQPGIEAKAFNKWRDVLRIRVSPSGAGQPIALLSGGNQQKVLLARWLNADSKVLVLLEPTRGVDVGARQEIYATIRDLAKSGAAVLVATSDYEEVVQVADRAVVMAAGRVTRSLEPSDVTIAALTDASGG
jgi:ribose transport system ATP-binding protein